MRPLIAALLLLAVAPAAAVAAPEPFGHPCAPANGVRFCPTAELGDRVASFDGTPLDVDVTLPAAGEGPFPVIVMEHGFPGEKTSFQADTPEGKSGSTYHYNNVFYAQQGYAVVTMSARGFGRSCGTPESRTAGCERGWTHIADHRYEVRDIQWLLGLLVDQEIASADALGVTGVSGGGGRTIAAAFLHDRIRNPDGSFAPWTSPKGTPLRFAAAFARWGWSDLATALVPNGRATETAFGPLAPIGVPKSEYLDLLYLGGSSAGFLAPEGADPHIDLTGWRERTKQGEPYGSDVRRIAEILRGRIGGAAGIPGASAAPLLLANGWNDDLFPVDEITRVYERLKAADRDADVSLLIGDIGHGAGAGNPVETDRDFNDRGAAFFASRLRGASSPLGPGARAYLTACPKGSVGRVLQATSYRALRRGRVVVRGPRAQRVGSRGGRRSVATAQKQMAPCTELRSRREPRSATYRGVSKGFTLIGAPTVRARIRTRGDDGQLAARLWAVDGRRQRLISRGVYRLRDDQRGRIRFQLHPQGWRFARGARFKLELLGRDAPYAQASRRRFSVRVRRLTLSLPAAESPSRRHGIIEP